MPKSKAYANPLPSMADEQRYGTKCHELRAKIREIERENQNIQLKIVKSKKNIQRLRIERSVLYEALATVTASAADSAGLAIPPQAQPTSHQSLPTSHHAALQPPQNPHNGYQAANLGSNRPFTDNLPPAGNHSQIPSRSYSKSSESAAPNGIPSLLNSSSNGHHGPPPPIPHGQYPKNLPVQVHHHSRVPASHTQLAPIVAEGAPTSTRYSSASTSPIAANNHFGPPQLGGRSMALSTHHLHNHFPSPHHHHHHHHHHHPVEHSRSNTGSSAPVLPIMHSHTSSSQSVSNGNGTTIKVENREEEAEHEEEEEEEEEDDDDEGEEEEDEEGASGSLAGGAVSGRPMDEDMEMDAEGDEEE